MVRAAALGRCVWCLSSCRQCASFRSQCSNARASACAPTTRRPVRKRNSTSENLESGHNSIRHSNYHIFNARACDRSVREAHAGGRRVHAADGADKRHAQDPEPLLEHGVPVRLEIHRGTT